MTNEGMREGDGSFKGRLWRHVAQDLEMEIGDSDIFNNFLLVAP